MVSAHSKYDELSRVIEFEVRLEHLKLLRHAWVSWDDCEFGAPAVDCKRPYGNSDVIGDVAEIMEVPHRSNCDCSGGYGECFTEEVRDHFTQLHAETGVVLQIALAVGEFRVGKYERSRYDIDWRRVGGNEGGQELSGADQLRQSAREAFALGRITREDLSDRMLRIAVIEQQQQVPGDEKNSSE